MKPLTTLKGEMPAVTQTLANVIGAQANIVDFPRNQQVGPKVYPDTPAEYSNRRAEQFAYGLEHRK